MSPYLHTCADRHHLDPGPSFFGSEPGHLPELISSLAPGEGLLIEDDAPGSEAGRERAGFPSRSRSSAPNAVP